MEGSQGYLHHQPPSPSTGRPQINRCMEELLKLTLTSSIDGTLGLDIGLSNAYCSNLLKDDPLSPNDNTSSATSDVAHGVPTYPLYKFLGSALYQAITSGTVSRSYEKISIISERKSSKKQDDAWIQLIIDKGSEILNVLENVEFELHVQEPYFSQLKDGHKTVEGKCAVGDYNRIIPGAHLLFNKCLAVQVQDVHRYASFREMLEAEGLTKVLPGVKTIEEGIQVYRKFYSEEKERANGVLAICVNEPVVQPYISLSSILLGLGYGGVQKLLGFANTVGTSSEALPPPVSTLLSSFLLPHSPHVLGSTLTDGARALAKHVHRSSSEFWGIFAGSDSDKNKLAKDAVSNLIANCSWQNMHIVSPHGVVYEIRSADGYGARWSEDGSKFIGFLEPYMEDGHSKGWKH